MVQELLEKVNCKSPCQSCNLFTNQWFDPIGHVLRNPTLHKLIGLKSDTLSNLSTFGTRVMSVTLNPFNMHGFYSEIIKGLLDHRLTHFVPHFLVEIDMKPIRTQSFIQGHIEHSPLNFIQFERFVDFSCAQSLLASCKDENLRIQQVICDLSPPTILKQRLELSNVQKKKNKNGICVM